MLKIILNAFAPCNSKKETILFIRNISLIFLVLLIANVIKIIKDSYVTVMIGAEMMGFTKCLLEVPMTLLFFFVYTKLINKFNTETVFRVIFLIYLLVLCILPIFFFQYYDSVVPSKEYIHSLITMFPYLKWIIVIFSNWPYALYFVLAEVWPVVSCSVLLWQFINKFTSTQESAKFYISYTMYGQTSLIASSFVISSVMNNMIYFDKIADFLFISVNQDDKLLKILSILLLFTGFIVLSLHFLSEKFYSNSINIRHIKKQLINEKIKIKDILFLMKTPIIRNICMIILCYGVTVTMIHLCYLSAMKTQYYDSMQFMKIQSKLNCFTGGLIILFGVFGSYITRFFGWSLIISATPFFTLFFGSLFFFFAIFYSQSSYMLLAIIFGAIEHVAVRASKYIFFDASKERLFTFITDQKTRTNAKVLSDLLGFKFGRLLGSLSMTIPLILSPNSSYIDFFSLSACIFIAIVCYWLYIANNVSNHINKTHI